PRRELPEHGTANDDDQRRIDGRPRPQRPIDRRETSHPPLDVDFGVIGNQPLGAIDLRHDGVAGIDAEPALDAIELGAVANVDADRADGDALMAIDAVAGRRALRLQLEALLDRNARLAAIIAVGDVESLVIGQRRLDARPGAHELADLPAHDAGERISREGEDRDPDIGRKRRGEGRELAHQRRRIGEIEYPGPAGPPGDHNPDGVLGHLAPELAEAPRGFVQTHALAPIALEEAL